MLIGPISRMWKSYVQSFLESSPEPRRVVLRQLQEIAHQSIAWTGFVLSKYASPQFFDTCVTKYMKAPPLDDDGDLLKSLDKIDFPEKKNMNGREYLRSTTFALGHALMATGCKGSSKMREGKNITIIAPDEQSLETIVRKGIIKQVVFVTTTMKRQLKAKRDTMKRKHKAATSNNRKQAFNNRRCSNSSIDMLLHHRKHRRSSLVVPC